MSAKQSFPSHLVFKIYVFVAAVGAWLVGVSITNQNWLMAGMALASTLILLLLMATSKSEVCITNRANVLWFCLSICLSWIILSLLLRYIWTANDNPIYRHEAIW